MSLASNIKYHLFVTYTPYRKSIADGPNFGLDVTIVVGYRLAIGGVK